MNPLKSAGSNFGLKLLALLCSIMLWAYVQRQEPATVPITTRLEVRGLSDDLVATTALSQVTVIASGPRVYTNRIDPNAIRAYLDLHNRSNGQYRLDVKVEASETIRALVSVAPAPEKVDVRIQQKTKRDVPVQVEWQGEARPGRVTLAKLDPGYVPPRRRIGHEQVVPALARIPAGDPSVSGSYPVVPVDAQGRLVANVTLIRQREGAGHADRPTGNGRLSWWSITTRGQRDLRSAPCGRNRRPSCWSVRANA